MDIINHKKISSEKGLLIATHPNGQPPTPSFAKRKMIQEKTDIRSPTDSMVSPCTRRLMKKIAKDVHAFKQLTVEEKENTAH